MQEFDTDSDRAFALKVPRYGTSGQEELARLLREHTRLQQEWELLKNSRALLTDAALRAC